MIANAALSTVARRTTLDVDVAIVAPGRAPAVLHSPVLLAVQNTIADHEYTVVKIKATGIVGQNTTCVMLEHSLISLDGHGHWLLCHSSLQSMLSRWDRGAMDHIARGESERRWGHHTAATVLEHLAWRAHTVVDDPAGLVALGPGHSLLTEIVSDQGAYITRADLASDGALHVSALRRLRIGAHIWIVFFGHEAILRDEGKCLIHGAAIAGFATCVACDDLLFGQALQLAASDKHGTLQGTS